MHNWSKRLAKIEAAVRPPEDDSLRILFLAKGQNKDEFHRFARQTYGFGRYLVVSFIESDRAIADMPAQVPAFESGGRVLPWPEVSR